MFNLKVKKDLLCETHNSRISHLCLQHDCSLFMKPLCKFCRANHSTHPRRLLPLEDFLIQFKYFLVERQSHFPRRKSKHSHIDRKSVLFSNFRQKLKALQIQLIQLDQSLQQLQKTASATSLGRIRALSKIHKSITQSQSVVELEDFLEAASYLLNINQRGQFEFRGEFQKNHIQLRNRIKGLKDAIEEQGTRCQEYVQKVLDVLAGDHQYNQIQTLPVLIPANTDFIIKQLSAHKVVSISLYNTMSKPAVSTQTTESDSEKEIQCLREQLGKVRMYERQRMKTIHKLESELENNQFQSKHLTRKFRQINVKNAQLVNQNKTLSSENMNLSSEINQLNQRLKLYFDKVLELPPCEEELAKTKTKFQESPPQERSMAATRSKWRKQL